MFFSVGVGFFAGLAAAFVVARRIVAAFLRKAPVAVSQRIFVLKMAAAGGFVALLPSLILGIVVGATLGGVYGQTLAGGTRAGSLGLVAGVALGTFTVVVLVLCLAIALGACLGIVVARRQGAAH